MLERFPPTESYSAMAMDTITCIVQVFSTADIIKFPSSLKYSAMAVDTITFVQLFPQLML
jgi:hypothetical protein